MRYYVKNADGIFLGPFSVEQLRSKTAENILDADWLALIATGQSQRQLKQNTDWITVGKLLDPSYSHTSGEETTMMDTVPRKKMKIPQWLQKTFVAVLIISLGWLILFGFSEADNIINYVANEPDGGAALLVFLGIPFAVMCLLLKLLRWMEVCHLSWILLLFVAAFGFGIMAVDLMPGPYSYSAADNRAALVGALYIGTGVSLLIFVGVGLFRSFAPSSSMSIESFDNESKQEASNMAASVQCDLCYAFNSLDAMKCHNCGKKLTPKTAA